MMNRGSIPSCGNKKYIDILGGGGEFLQLDYETDVKVLKIKLSL
jgi:hypothetical protein